MNRHPLKSLVDFHSNKQCIGIYSACTANELVIEACMEKALDDGSLVLIEATPNQVNQYGGYTNMRPIDFKNFVYKIAERVNLPQNQIILGADHLGPLTFSQYDEARAMDEACELIRQFIEASFTKIHIDTSMKLASDRIDVPLTNEVIAKRTATLVKVAETTYNHLTINKPDALHPIYIIGSEVPTPGGSIDTDTTNIQITKPEDLIKTINIFEQVFIDEAIYDAWSDVIAIVVQPGIEENDTGCIEYNHEKAKDLMLMIQDYPNLVFEGHSTDYQTKYKLKELVNDGVAILKVGPALSFAAREAIFALAYIENELYKDTPIETSNFIEVLDKAMLNKPSHWHSHYHGNTKEIALKRKYSFSDRSRYYMQENQVKQSLNILLNNLENGVPLNLLSQFMPLQYTKVKDKTLNNSPEELIKDRIKVTIDEYLFATSQNKIPFN